MRITQLVAAGAMLLMAHIAHAQWNPSAGQWGKTDPSDLRVMTWNIQDGICTSQPKIDGTNNWGAIARIIAVIKPDVLILQETGDNEGNGTGAGVDSAPQLVNLIDLLIHGGKDPYRSNQPITGYVQLFAPQFELPYVYASTISDGYNRNVIASRYPFADLNGDTIPTISDIPNISTRSNSYAMGGTGGIRGFMWAEIDLPNAIYAGDLVVGNAHLKSGSASGDYDQRLRAVTNVAYYIDYMFNGGGMGVPDPRNVIGDFPAAKTIMPPNTTIVYGGDWNEDELTNGRRGPAEWLTQAEFAGSTDGTDRDRSDSVYDSATDPFTGSRATLSSSKLDHLAWEDSVATVRRAFIMNTATIPSTYPPEFAGITRPRDLTGAAADHRPVVVDLMLPLAPPPLACPGDTNGDGEVNSADLSVLLGQFDQSVTPGEGADFNNDGTVNAADLSVLLGQFGVQCN